MQWPCVREVGKAARVRREHRLAVDTGLFPVPGQQGPGPKAGLLEGAERVVLQGWLGSACSKDSVQLSSILRQTGTGWGP